MRLIAVLCFVTRRFSLLKKRSLVTTKARIKEVRRFAENLVTLARTGNTFNARRRKQRRYCPTRSLLWCNYLPKLLHAMLIVLADILALSLGRRVSDTAEMAKLEWVL